MTAHCNDRETAYGNEREHPGKQKQSPKGNQQGAPKVQTKGQSTSKNMQAQRNSRARMAGYPAGNMTEWVTFWKKT